MIFLFNVFQTFSSSSTSEQEDDYVFVEIGVLTKGNVFVGISSWVLLTFMQFICFLNFHLLIEISIFSQGF